MQDEAAGGQNELQFSPMNEESPLQFPCEFPIKALGLASDALVEEVMCIVRTHAPATPDSAMRSNPSQGGKYLSITVTIEAHSRDQLDAIYMELTASSLVMMAL